MTQIYAVVDSDPRVLLAMYTGLITAGYRRGNAVPTNVSEQGIAFIPEEKRITWYSRRTDDKPIRFSRLNGTEMETTTAQFITAANALELLIDNLGGEEKLQDGNESNCGTPLEIRFENEESDVTVLMCVECAQKFIQGDPKFDDMFSYVDERRALVHEVLRLHGRLPAEG